MPGFFITNTEKVPELNNYDNTRCVKGELRYKQWTVKWNVLDKFFDDKVFYQDEDVILILDGVILNKNEILKNSYSMSWHDTIKKLFFESNTFFNDFRGAFSGAVFDKNKECWTVFTDHIGNRLVLKYADESCVAFGSQLNYFSDWMKLNSIERKLSTEWENDFFSYGYMLDKYSVISGVERVFPGCFCELDLKQNRLEEKSYYEIEKRVCERSIDETIEGFDSVFEQAVLRNVNKCAEYGYKAVADISGGLDSRMIAACLCKNGYNDACTGINYSQSGAKDQTIAKQVSSALNIETTFYKMDGGECLKDIDNLVFMNNGMNYYAGITGGKTVLESLDRGSYGLELWGILGDIYEGAMISDGCIEKPDWNYPRFKTINRFENNNTHDREYADNEIMWFYIRGILAGENTAFIRQNFMEAPAVFGDVDLLDFIFSIPYDMRVEKRVYLRWLVKKYPEMAEIPYSHTGLRIIANQTAEKLVLFPIRIKRKLASMINSENYRRTVSMNPMDYWLETNPSLCEYYDSYFNSNIKYTEDFPCSEKIISLYNGGNSSALEKIVALTAVSAIKQFLN